PSGRSPRSVRRPTPRQACALWRADVSSGAIQHRGEKSVAALTMRIKTQHRPGIERDLRARKLGGRVAERELGMRGQKTLDDRLVFVGQHAAGRVDEAPTRLDQGCRG